MQECLCLQLFLLTLIWYVITASTPSNTTRKSSRQTLRKNRGRSDRVPTCLQYSLKRSKERTRKWAMQGISLKPSLLNPSKLPKDPIFTYFQEETEKKDGASCVFLLWSSENSEIFTTWAVDVPMTDVEFEHDIFDSLAKRYHEELSLLRRCLSF